MGLLVWRMRPRALAVSQLNMIDLKHSLIATLALVTLVLGSLQKVRADELGADEPKGETAAVAKASIDMAPVRERAEAEGLSLAAALQAMAFEKLEARDVSAAVPYLDAINGVKDDLAYGKNERFLSARQRIGFTTGLRAHLAYQNSDYETFEKLVASTVIDAPGYAEAFGFLGMLSQLREKEAMDAAMADFRVPMDMEIASVDGETKTLKAWMGDNKALLVDFWASWCGPCMQLMPELKEKSEKLSAQGIYVAGLNTDDSDQLNKAKKVQETRGMEGVPWLLDPDGSTLSGLLFVDSIPRMVLIDPEGEVLYNGHPMDPGLSRALADFGVKL